MRLPLASALKATTATVAPSLPHSIPHQLGLMRQPVLPRRHCVLRASTTTSQARLPACRAPLDFTVVSRGPAHPQAARSGSSALRAQWNHSHAPLGRSVVVHICMTRHHARPASLVIIVLVLAWSNRRAYALQDTIVSPDQVRMPLRTSHVPALQLLSMRPVLIVAPYVQLHRAVLARLAV
jgi:hypothetical protein